LKAKKKDVIQAIYHLSIKIIKRTAAKSAVGAAAYRAAEKILNDYNGLTHDYTRKKGVIHSEIMLPDHAPPEYADRSTLWNAVEAVEKNKNSQLAREIEIALPKELSQEENIELAKEYVKKNFVNHGMVADVCFHDKSDGNPHVHIMLTMRPMNLDGSWGDKQRKEYILDSNGEKIYDKKKRQYKCKSIATTDWNEQSKAEEWRQAWADEVNAFLLRKNIDTRIDHRSYKRQGIEIIPTIHMGAAASEMERNGIKTEKGNINREIKEENNLIKMLKNTIENIKSSIADLFLCKTELKNLIAEERKPKGENLIVKLMRFHENGGKFNQSSAPYLRNLKNLKGLQNVASAVAFLQTNNISTVEELQSALNSCKEAHSSLKSSTENKKTRIAELDTLLENYHVYKEYKPILTEYESIKSERKREKYAILHFEEIKQCKSARKKLPDKLTPKAWAKEREQLETECAANNQKRTRLEDGIAQMETIGRNMESLDRYEKKQERERSKSMDIGL
jgi:ATP-dependent exoDNAse (exonuclease V) alpha subunit